MFFFLSIISANSVAKALEIAFNTFFFIIYASSKPFISHSIKVEWSVLRSRHAEAPIAKGGMFLASTEHYYSWKK